MNAKTFTAFLSILLIGAVLVRGEVSCHSCDGKGRIAIDTHYTETMQILNSDFTIEEKEYGAYLCGQLWLYRVAINVKVQNNSTEPSYGIILITIRSPEVENFTAEEHLYAGIGGGEMKLLSAKFPFLLADKPVDPRSFKVLISFPMGSEVSCPFCRGKGTICLFVYLIGKTGPLSIFEYFPYFK